MPPARNPRDILSRNYHIANDPSRQEFYLCSKTPTDSDPFGDGDQSPLRFAAAQRLRDDWAEGMGHDIGNLSEFGRACFLGQVSLVEKMLMEFDDDDVRKKRLLERRESGMRFNSMLNVICGHKQLKAFPGNPPMFGHLDTAKVLLKYGVNVHARDVAGYSALHFCTNLNSSETTLKIAELLLQHGADINARNRFGCCPLHEPVMLGDEAAVIFLLEHDADVHVGENDAQLTPAKLGMNRPSISRLISEYTTRKLRREMKKQLQKCGYCENVGDQKCSACRAISYCSAECQKKHWKEHKARCKEIRNEKLIIPTAPSKVYDPLNMHEGDLKKHETNAEFSVKIQLSTLAPESAPMLIYDRTRSFRIALHPKHSGFGKMVRKIRADGVLGVKAYFNASVDKDLNLVVDSGVVLRPKDW